MLLPPGNSSEPKFNEYKLFLGSINYYIPYIDILMQFQLTVYIVCDGNGLKYLSPPFTLLLYIHQH